MKWILAVCFAAIAVQAPAQSFYAKATQTPGKLLIGQPTEVAVGNQQQGPWAFYLYPCWALTKAPYPLQINRWLAIDLMPDGLTWMAAVRQGPFWLFAGGGYFDESYPEYRGKIYVPNHPVLVGTNVYCQVLAGSVGSPYLKGQVETFTLAL